MKSRATLLPHQPADHDHDGRSSSARAGARPARGTVPSRSRFRHRPSLRDRADPRIRAARPRPRGSARSTWFAHEQHHRSKHQPSTLARRGSCPRSTATRGWCRWREYRRAWLRAARGIEALGVWVCTKSKRSRRKSTNQGAERTRRRRGRTRVGSARPRRPRPPGGRRRRSPLTTVHSTSSSDRSWLARRTLAVREVATTRAPRRRARASRLPLPDGLPRSSPVTVGTASAVASVLTLAPKGPT